MPPYVHNSYGCLVVCASDCWSLPHGRSYHALWIIIWLWTIWLFYISASQPFHTRPDMNACTILLVGLLCYPPRGLADQAVRPTQDMLINGVSRSCCYDDKSFSEMSLNYKGISYLPADTFVDFPNITVSFLEPFDTGFNISRLIKKRTCVNTDVKRVEHIYGTAIFHRNIHQRHVKKEMVVVYLCWFKIYLYPALVIVPSYVMSYWYN